MSSGRNTKATWDAKTSYLPRTRSSYTQVWWVYFIFGLFLALLLPSAISNYPIWINGIAVGVANFIPSSRRLVELSAFPGASAVWWALMWMSLPVAILVAGTYKERADCKKFFLNHWRKSSSMLVLGLVILPSMFFYLLVFGMSDHTINSSKTTGKLGIDFLVTSKFGLGLIGSFLMTSTGMLMGVIASHLSGAYDYLLKSN